MQAISVGHSVRACQSTLSVPQSALHCQSSTAHSTQTRHSNILLSILNCTELHCHRQTIVVPSSSISPYLFWPPIKTQFSHLLYMHVNGHALIFSDHMTIHLNSHSLQSERCSSPFRHAYERASPARRSTPCTLSCGCGFSGFHRGGLRRAPP